ncbi:hypothetical protein ALI144C_37700 [Actinosynnema sp. ALI-1.44]|uniref:hypothetical protein n=1 Tax=Actinosynnema sp. ALI-1.44 TaxID=1933779 RepID=UPI00097BD33F|nr:hypothetical protein [Actinosynnema sp. ALI-1.44]ONI76381.1 hypothetical protein ALI144C_37700 [Actinosynnema sp. ALI-1.44]
MIPRKRRGLLVTAVAALVAPLLSVSAGAAESGILADTDVYIRDYVGDAGVEPHGNSVWTSPDIKVCPTSTECPTSVNPEVGQTNYIFVKLNSPGPYGSGADTGNLEVFRSTPGGGTGWISDWTSIGAAFDVPVAASGVTTVMIPWNGVPGPGHFCLLARWESANDPMSFPEGVNTVLNTQRNNNLAWRNVDSVDLFAGKPEVRPYAIGNPGSAQISTDLAFTDTRNGFTAAGGKLVIDLGPTVYSRWREGGGRATGVRQVGTYSFEISDFRQARFYGIRLAPRTRPEMKLVFSTTTAPRKGSHVIRVNQFAPVENGQSAPAAAIDVGGVEYQVTIR